MSNDVKSFRLDARLMPRINGGVNFSNLINKALDEYLSKSIWLPNFHIEEYANLSAKKVFDRVQSVKALRHSDSALVFTLYPGDEKEISKNKAIHAYANGDYNLVHDSHVYFNIEFPTNFLLYLKSKTWNEVEHFIQGFLSLLFYLEPDKRKIMEHQLDKRILKSIVKRVRENDFKNLESIDKENQKKNDPKLRAQFDDAFFKMLINLGIDPLMFPFVGQILTTIHHPFHFNDAIKRESYDFDIKLAAGYMRNIYDEKDDWQSIVVYGTNKTDGLIRSESKAEPWISWCEEYCFYHYKELKGKIIKR